MTAAPDALEHHAGYLAALSPAGRANRATEGFRPGTRLRLPDSGLSIKRYPMCYATHRVIDGVLELAQANDVSWQEVAEVRATIGNGEASMLRNHCPVTGLEAKFSLEFAVACALVARRVGLAELTDRFVAEPAVRETMNKVRISTVDTACPIDPAFAVTHRVVLALANGRTLDSGEIRFTRGNARLPLSKDDLAAKFLDCTSAALDIDGPSLYEDLARLEELAAIRHLVREVAAA
jgi:aconitate decarboxylase